MQQLKEQQVVMTDEKRKLQDELKEKDEVCLKYVTIYIFLSLLESVAMVCKMSFTHLLSYL